MIYNPEESCWAKANTKTSTRAATGTVFEVR
jgi:hypothetical protein